MNSNERKILDILSKDPLISQSKLSEMLRITRSSVSVYISNLMQDGYILGRGYLINNQNMIYVIGSTVIDYRTVSVADVFFEDSTLVMDDTELKMSYGGSARNISEGLVRLGNEVSCISAIGDDMQGKDLVESCKNLGIDVSDVLIVPAKRTSTYLEIRSVNQERIMFSASDTKLQHSMTPQFLMEKQYKLKHARYIITEDGVSSESLRHLSSTYGKVIMIAMKVGRTKSYRDFVNQFNGLMLSLQCACELLGIPYGADETDANVMKIALQIKEFIAGPLLICYGKSNTCYCDEGMHILCSYRSKLPNASLYSHYRDSVAAGFVNSLFNGVEGEDLLKYVSACREVSAETNLNINSTMCPELVEKKISEMEFRFIHFSTDGVIV